MNDQLSPNLQFDVMLKSSQFLINTFGIANTIELFHSRFPPSLKYDATIKPSENITTINPGITD